MDLATPPSRHTHLALVLVTTLAAAGCDGRSACERYADDLAAKSQECGLDRQLTTELDLTSCSPSDEEIVACGAACFDALTCAGLTGKDHANLDAYHECGNRCPGGD